MTKDTGLIRHSNTSSTTAVLWSAIFITRTTWSCWSVTTLTCHEHFCPWFSDLAGSTQCFEPKPHRQLPSVPQSCCSGCPSFTGQQAQQPVLCPVSVPSGPIMPAWRKQPLHRGQCPWLHFNLIREYISEEQWNENKKLASLIYNDEDFIYEDHIRVLWPIGWHDFFFRRWCVSAQTYLHPHVPSPGPFPFFLAVQHLHVGLRKNMWPLSSLSLDKKAVLWMKQNWR